MQIVIVTAEPLGAYHLVPLHPAMRAATASGHHFTHLIPYPENVQGIAWESTSADLRILEDGDIVVITGGGYTAWTELIARRCEQLGVRFVMTELAYGAQPDGRSYPHPVAASALSPAGAENLAEYHCVALDTITVTGTPLLDDLPVWQPQPGRVLLLSSVDATTRDPELLLPAIGHQLREAGHDVVVRCHPREDRSMWDGFTLDNSSTAAQAARHAEFVIGYPGSAHPIVAAIGVPVVAVAPTDDLRHALPPTQALVIPTWVNVLDDISKIGDAVATSPEMIRYVNGPVGGAGERVVRFWLDQVWRLKLEGAAQRP